MQKPQVILSKRARKQNRISDAKPMSPKSPTVHMEYKERPSHSESKIPRDSSVPAFTVTSSAPPKSRAVKFMEDVMTSPSQSNPDCGSVKKISTPISTCSERESSKKKKLLSSSAVKSPPKSQSPFVQKYTCNSRSSSSIHAITHMYFGLGVLVFIIMMLGDPWFVRLYNYLSHASAVPTMAQFGDSVLPTGRFRDDRYFRTSILSPQDGQIVISPVLTWSADGVALGGSNELSREFYIDVKLDSKPIIFPDGNKMTIKLNGQFNLSVDLSHYGLTNTGAHEVTLEMLIVPDPNDLHFFKTSNGKLLLAAQASSVFYFTASESTDHLGENLASSADLAAQGRSSSVTPSHDGTNLMTEGDSRGRSTDELRPYFAADAASLKVPTSATKLDTIIDGGAGADLLDAKRYSDSAMRMFSESSFSSGSELLSQEKIKMDASSSFSLLKGFSNTPPSEDTVLSLAARSSGFAGTSRPTVQHTEYQQAPDESKDSPSRRMRKLQYVKRMYLRADGGCDDQRKNEVDVALLLSERLLIGKEDYELGKVVLSVDRESYDITGIVAEQVASQEFVCPELFQHSGLSSSSGTDAEYRFKEVSLRLGGSHSGTVHTVEVSYVPMKPSRVEYVDIYVRL